MQFPEFLVVAILCSIIFYRSALGQISEVISRIPAVEQDGKVTVNFGDLVIEVKPPRGREDIVNTQPIYERWQNVDDVTYWESIYGSMDDIPAFEDLPEIPGETVELKYVNEWEEEDSNKNPTKIANKDQSEASIKTSSKTDGQTESSTTEPLKATNPYPDRCERINPLYPMLKSWNRQKREINASKELEPEAEETSKSDSNRKRKGRTLSLLQGGREKTRLKSNLRSDYLFNKYGRKNCRPNKFGRGFSSKDDCIDDDGVTGASGSEKFVDSAINTVESVNSGLAKTSEAVGGTIVNSARQLAQAKRNVIDLGHRAATQAVVLGSLNNAEADCLKEEEVGVATNIDSGLEVVGNSVLDTNSGIINADTDTNISVGVTASLNIETNLGVDTAVGSVLNSDNAVTADIISDAVVESNAELAVEEAVKEEIAVAENEQEIDLVEAEVVGETLVTEEIVADTTQVETPVLESGVEISSHVEGGVNVVADTETSVGSALQVNAASGIHTSLNAEISTGSKTDVNVQKSDRYDHARRVFGGQCMPCDCATSLEDDSDREFDLRRRYCDECNDEQEDRRRFHGRSRHGPYSQDYYGGHRSGIHADAGIHSSLDTGIDVDSNVGSVSTGTTASLDLNSNLDIGSSTISGVHADSGIHTSLNTDVDIGRTRSNYRTYGYDRDRLRHCGDFDSAEDICDFDSEEYREFKRRFPDNFRNSGIHADAGIHTSFDTGLGINTNHGSVNTGTAASVDVESNLDIGTSKINSDRLDGLTDSITRGRNHRFRGDFDRNDGICDCDDYEEYRMYRRRFPGIRGRGHHGSHSEIHADAGIHTSLDTGVGLDSNRASIHSGTAASLDLESNLDIGRAGLRSHEGSRIYGDFDRNKDVCECEDSEEYREYRRRFPDGRFHPSHRGIHNSGVHANAGIHTSLDADVNVNTGIDVGGVSSGIHADSGVHSSLDAGLGLNSDVGGTHLHTGSRASLDADSHLEVERIRRPDGIYRGYERGRGTLADYDDYDDEREYGRYPAGRYRNRHRGTHSGIHAASGIHTSLETGADINAGSAGLHAGAKSSLNLDSHIDIGTTTLAVNGADPLHRPDTINSAAHADAGIHTSLNSGLGINAGRRLHGGIEPSLDLDSHLDIGTRINGPEGELGEKICEAACRRTSDFRMHDCCPNSRFEPDGPGGSSYICDNCRKLLCSGTNTFCPNCGRQDFMFAERRPFLSSGTIYHFDSLKQNCKRTVDPLEGNDMNPQNTYGYNRYINLDANCSDEAFRQSPDCQGLNDNLHMPRDGNPVSLGIVKTHLSHGHDIALDMHDRARSLVAGGLHPCPHTASMLHFFNSKVPGDLVNLNEESELTLFGTKLLQHKLSVDYNITPNNFLEFLNHHGFRVTGNRICRCRQKRCGGYNKFRSLDGSCNNVAHPTWGQSNRAFARILPARYSDGIHGMPVSVTGADLPNPRKLSVRLYSRSSKLDPELTLAVMQWGQTLAHDWGRQVMDQTTNGGIECCADNGKRHLPKSLQHHSCAPITISPRDKFYSRHGQRCMNFVRAMTVSREDCTLGPADQLNGATSFLDCSAMYGPDKTTSDELREFTGGRMKVEFRSGRWMPPTMTNRSNFCDIWTSDDVCYRTGDPRNNQNPQLVILQTMLVREHNRLADGLKALNPDWNDERIFQESRRIVIAEYQHITYNEWLPLVLGRRYAKKHGLIRTEPGMSNAYNERVNPTTITGFTSGAFRSLHSMIDGDIGLCNVGGEIIESFRLSDHFFRPKVIEKNNNFEHLLRGLAMQRMPAQDMNMHRELTEYLFRSRNDYGMDLAAIDIQRGRDHGVPSYNAYRKICRLEPANDFDDLSNEISWENIEKLRRDYAHVDDIDLIVGATMENRSPGSQFGPTNRCLIGEQFYRSRVGDRYFYDNANLSHSFTPEQFNEITKVTLSRLMCDMGGAVGVVQRNAFRVISEKNPLIPCEDLPKLDLTLWME